MSHQPDIPPSDHPALGAFVSSHSYSAEQAQAAVAILSVLSLLGGFSIYKAISAGNMYMTIPGSFMIVAVCFLAVMAIKGLRTRLQLYENGFVLNGREIFRWSDITAVYQREESYSYGTVPYIPLGRFQSFIVQRKDGRRFEINDNLEKVERLGDAVLRGTFDELWPAHTKAFDAGEELSFGPIKLSATGLTLKGNRFAWDRLKPVQTNAKNVFVKEKGAWLSWDVPIKHIPNLPIMLALIHRAQARCE